MPRITLDLIRKKSEHHDGLLADLQELSLHQLNLEKIELLGSVCKRLQILYLQHNLIGKIENLNKLKELRYLNLALNNILVIENLEGCEKLEKLDLTVNFIDVDRLEESMRCLKNLEFFTQLCLIGNPCTEFSRYREYVIGALPRLKILDGKEISKTERLAAEAAFAAAQEALRIEAQKRIEQREKERMEDELAEKILKAKAEGKTIEEVEHKIELPDGETLEEYYARRLRQKEMKYTPESRYKIYLEEVEKKKQEENEEQQAKERFGEAPDLMKEAYAKLNAKATLNPDGSRPSQRNTGKYPFRLTETDDDQALKLEIEVPRFLDTSAIEVDVHPTWIQCLIKGKNLLLHFDEEISVDDTKVQRIMTSGKLVITLPKRHPPKRRVRNSNTPLPAKITDSTLRGAEDDLDADLVGATEPQDVEYVGPKKKRQPKSGSSWETKTVLTETRSSASLNSAIREVSSRVSQKLLEERRKAEDAEIQARHQALMEAQRRAQEEAEARRKAKANDNIDLSELSKSLGIDLDDLPDLE